MTSTSHIASELFASLGKKPGAPAIVDYGFPSPVRLNRGTLLVTALRLAKDLKREIECERVGVVLPPGLAGALSNLALFLADKIPVNLNFTLGPGAVSHSMKEAGIGTVLTAKALIRKFPAFPWPEDCIDVGDRLKAYRGEKGFLLRQLIRLRIFPKSLA